jgi:CheY-like chemotaxis protein
MLDISRLTRGGLRIEHAPVDLGEIVRRALEMSAPAIEAGRHALEVDVPATPLRVDGDAHRLTQLVGNLLNNSARYTPEGGRISVRVAREQGWALVCVRDTGRGIEPQIIERIFDMFVQGRAPLQRVGEGLGIGLALARSIAELHGGTLEGHSEGPGKGSEFVVRLPLLAAAIAAAPAADADSGERSSAPLVPRRILVVDDNVDAANTLNLLLRSLGHETCVVHDGVKALKMAVEFRPDVVLLDIGMPGLDGYEVARRLNSLKKERRFRIVAVTGWGQESDRERSRAAGFDLHLIKPVDAGTLQRALEGKNGTTLH